MKKFSLILLIVFVGFMFFGCELPNEITYDVYILYPNYSSIYIDRKSYDENDHLHSSIYNYHSTDGTYHYHWTTNDDNITVWFRIEDQNHQYIDQGNVYLNRSTPSKTYIY